MRRAGKRDGFLGRGPQRVGPRRALRGPLLNSPIRIEATPMLHFNHDALDVMLTYPPTPGWLVFLFELNSRGHLDSSPNKEANC